MDTVITTRALIVMQRSSSRRVGFGRRYSESSRRLTGPSSRQASGQARDQRRGTTVTTVHRKYHVSDLRHHMRLSLRVRGGMACAFRFTLSKRTRLLTSHTLFGSLARGYFDPAESGSNDGAVGLLLAWLSTGWVRWTIVTWIEQSPCTRRCRKGQRWIQRYRKCTANGNDESVPNRKARAVTTTESGVRHPTPQCSCCLRLSL